MENKNQEYLVKEKLSTLSRKYALPCIISLLVGALYNIVDQIFIANADYLGSYGNAANTAVFPLTVIALAVSVMVGDGCCAFVAFAIAELCPNLLIQIFGAANESAYYTDFAVKAFRIYLSMTVFAGVNKASFIFLQAMGKAAASTALSMIREVVFGVGFAVLLPRFFGLDGVLYSMPVSDVLTAVISAIVIAFAYKQLSQPGEKTADAQTLC